MELIDEQFIFLSSHVKLNNYTEGKTPGKIKLSYKDTLLFVEVLKFYYKIIFSLFNGIFFQKILSGVAKSLNDNNLSLQISMLTLDPVLSTLSIKNNYSLLSPYFQRLGIIISEETLDHLALLEEISISSLLNKVIYKIKGLKELDESPPASPSTQQDYFSSKKNSLSFTQPQEIPHSADRRLTTPSIAGQINLTPLYPPANSLNNTYPVYSGRPSDVDLRARHMAQRQQNLYLRQLRDQQVCVKLKSFFFFFFFLWFFLCAWC
jgi:hypothetical protein